MTSENQQPNTPHFYDLLVQNYPAYFDALGELGKAARLAGPLEEMTVQLVQLAGAAAIRSEGGVHSHTRRALAAGASADAIRHVIISLTSTIGFPNVVAAMSWAEDVLAKTPDGLKPTTVTDDTASQNVAQ